MIDKMYKNFHPKPLLVAPSGFYEKEWYDKLLEVSGSNVVNVITHHIYNLGPGMYDWSYDTPYEFTSALAS